MTDSEFDRAQRRMLEEIAADARDTRSWTGRERFSEHVMAALARVPRHEFVLPDDTDYAYINRPRGIGHGQTISQPYIVALMTDILDLEPGDRVLEVGCGSGYQTAVLSELCAKVYSLETLEPLATTAAARLERLGYRNLEVRHGDGFDGWPEEAPFDAIVVTAAPDAIPEALVEQLKIGGRMAIPVGAPQDTQVLYLCRKDETGRTTRHSVLPVSFVPMIRRRTPKKE